MNTNNDLSKLSRKELLEILVAQSQEIEELQKQLEDKRILIENSGSIAEASLKLNGIFEVAQKAADQYLENIKRGQEHDEV